MANAMAFPQLIAVLTIAFVFSRLRLSSCSPVQGSVSCNDCRPDYDFSGIKVQVKCDEVKTVSEAITNKTGHFETNLPTDYPTTLLASTTPDCWAELVGGQNTVPKLSVTLSDNKKTSSQKGCNTKCQYKITQTSNGSGITVYAMLPNGTTVTITDANGTVTISNATVAVTATTTAQLYYYIP